MFKNFGFSLIEVMISIGIMSLVTFGVSSMISNQNKQIKVIGEKMSTNDVSQRLRMLLNNSDYCSCLFRGATFNRTTLSWNSTLSSFPNGFSAIPAFPGACTATASSFVTVDTPVDGSSMKFDQISFQNHIELPPGSGQYTADLAISFKNYVIKPRNIELPMIFKFDLTSGDDTARPFLSCQMGGSSTVSLTNCTWGAVFSCGAISCPAGQVQAGLETSPAFNEDCGGGGNDYDEPSRRLLCCDIN